jgi:hypothetical protein
MYPTRTSLHRHHRCGSEKSEAYSLGLEHLHRRVFIKSCAAPWEVASRHAPARDDTGSCSVRIAKITATARSQSLASFCPHGCSSGDSAWVDVGHERWRSLRGDCRRVSTIGSRSFAGSEVFQLRAKDATSNRRVPRPLIPNPCFRAAHPGGRASSTCGRRGCCRVRGLPSAA